MQSFAYQAQTTQGQAFSGTIDAVDSDAASGVLASLQLRVTEMLPTPQPRTARATLRGADFLAFNQHLSQLTASGLPVERSLRLLGREMRGRQASAVNAIAEELEKGTPLQAAFARHASVFPPLYGMLIEAGMKTSDLPGMLMNLSRHVEMLQRLRAAFWRAATYPLAVLTALLVVLGFLWFWVMPQMSDIIVGSTFADFHLETPGSWQVILPLARGINIVVIVAVAAILVAVLCIVILSRLPGGRALTERMLLPMPLVGPILRSNLLARWCDVFYLAVRAGLDLPAALTLAGASVGSRGLVDDSRSLAAAVSAGQPIDAASTQLLPALVPTALRLGAENHDLAESAAMLAKMYQDQAEMRLSILPQILSPIFMIVTAICIAMALLTVLLPFVAFINLVEGMTGFR